MKEYIVITDEEELYYNSFDYHELIHCKDCKYFHKDLGCVCVSGMVFPKEDSFCSKAERKRKEFSEGFFNKRRKEAESEK